MLPVELLQAIFGTGVAFALIYAIVIMIFAVVIAIYVQEAGLRSAATLVLAGIAYWLSFAATTTFGRDYFLSMITEFIGAFVSILLFESWITREKWTFPVVTLSILVIVGVLLGGAFGINRDFGMNLGTGLLGAYLTTVLLRRDWWWQDKAAWRQEIDSALTAEDRKELDASFTKALAAADLQVRLVGRSSRELEAKSVRLGQVYKVLAERGDFTDKKTGLTYRYVAAAVRKESALSSSPAAASGDQVQMTIQGAPDAVDSAVQRVHELFEVSSEDREDLSRYESRVALAVQASDVSLSDALHQTFGDLASQWKAQAGQAKSKGDTEAAGSPKQAYAHGVARALAQASEQLGQVLERI